ncbi:HNH endonuclease [Acidovorax sp. NPDC077693]|uniref:HNH endonuclease n=1 Tax=unclassified Acidovorax TaxID=2684926 RepID=UPI0037CA920A
MKYTVNITDIEQALLALGGEARAKAIQDHVLKVRCGESIPENYLHEKSFRQTIQRKMEDYCPQAEGFDLSRKEPKFIRIGHGLYRHANGSSQREFVATEEVQDAQLFVEGATRSISVNAYERNAEARKKCIEHFGWKCQCCGFSFEEEYGELGKAFIHVDHVKPLAEIKESYVVNPILDLVPLCANCHAMVHRVCPAITLEQLKAELKCKA